MSQCDVVTVNCPLHEGTRGLVNDELLKHFKKGAWLVNTARFDNCFGISHSQHILISTFLRGAICDKDAVAKALKEGRISGYSGGRGRFNLSFAVLDLSYMIF